MLHPVCCRLDFFIFFTERRHISEYIGVDISDLKVWILRWKVADEEKLNNESQVTVCLNTWAFVGWLDWIEFATD